MGYLKNLYGRIITRQFLKHGLREANIVPARKTGIPMIRGKNVSVQEILDLRTAGQTEEEILKLYKDEDLSLHDLLAAERYAIHDPMNRSPLGIIVTDLERSSFLLNGFGFFLFTVAVVLGIGLYLDIRTVTIDHIKEFLLPKSDSPPGFTETIYPRLFYLVVRSSALGAIAVTVLLALVRTAVACFDQSARFLKRRKGAQFLKYLFDTFSHDRLEQPVKIEDIRKFFESWNQNVESAFSHVKVSKKGAGSMELNVNEKGANVKVDGKDN